VSSPRHGHRGTKPGCVAPVPPRRLRGRFRCNGYHAPGRRKFTAEQEAVIRADGGTRSLRDLAAEFAVSHETIRAVLHEAGMWEI